MSEVIVVAPKKILYRGFIVYETREVHQDQKIWDGFSPMTNTWVWGFDSRMCMENIDAYWDWRQEFHRRQQYRKVGLPVYKGE